LSKQDDILLEKFRQELLIYMQVEGMEIPAIAEFLEVPEYRIERMLSEREIHIKIKSKKETIYGVSVDTKIQSLLPEAVKVLEDAMKSPVEKASTKIDAASRIMDRAMGKPSQEVKVSGLSMVELLGQMDLINENYRDATPLDEIDSFTEELIPRQITVGKREKK